ncbi:hypothetical protein EJP77_14745 [Paenibacillus zeisoli]|uniref:Uncharacterized protein n=1 Tax=Paenibacillus zeisoli TaxID=2496267 RepID=A0A433X6F5_9BACL|nr:PaaX family transcriptional regulator C-terminal domain-containing protein [Paenibacillus zeisoli]RUT29629.1 hypothetical protein EJP77_14745 [Paenibacillus zeisoli]
MLSLEKQILYMIRHRHYMTTSEIIDIYQHRGKNSQIIRNTLASLKQKGYIAVENRSYSVTESGLSVIRSLQIKMNEVEQPWDGLWYIIMFSFPERLRSLRNSFRRELTQVGYGALYDGVYICPFNRKDAILAFARKHGLEDMICMLHGQMDVGDITAVKAKQIWPIQELQKKYETFMRWSGEKQKQLTFSLERGEEITAWQVLLEILELGENFGEVLLEDPFLARELLPDQWPMKQAWNAYNQYLQQLLPLLQADTELLSLIVPTT